jgi:hypothetical protein
MCIEKEKPIRKYRRINGSTQQQNTRKSGFSASLTGKLNFEY